MVPDPAAVDPFERGVRLFNAHQFFECHEVWEELWRPSRPPERLFLQSLIHLAVAFYHHQQGNRDGRERQLVKGLRKLAGYLPRFGRVDTARLYRETVAWRESRGDYPTDYPKCHDQT
ncbi:MAG: DUF309 domain-containing protein [Bryobacteraceae bacterium]